jgi:hypothetical protein
MPFTLRVTFTGLCLFTVDRQDRPAGRLHAVLINYGEENAGGSATGHAAHRPRHYPRLVYDKAYETKGATELARRLACPALDGTELRFDDQGNAFRPLIPREVADLDEIAGVGPLNRRHVEPNPPPTVIARVTTNVGGFTGIGRTPRWTSAQGRREAWPRTITNRLEWTIADIPGDALDHWTLVGLDGSTGKRLPTLYPIDGVIDVWVFNAMMSELPPADSTLASLPGERAAHFDAYFLLFPGVPPVIPVLEIPEPDEDLLPFPSDCKPGGASMLESMHTSRCLTAQAPLA